MFLLLKCGEENIFMNKYSSQISSNKINIISIYDSPLCLPLINYYKSNLLITANSSFSNLKKLVAVDYNLNNYANYTDTLLKIILTNMTSEYRVILGFLLVLIKVMRIYFFSCFRFRML